MLGIDSIPEVKLKLGANSNSRQASFRELNKLIKKDAKPVTKLIFMIREFGSINKKKCAIESGLENKRCRRTTSDSSKGYRI